MADRPTSFRWPDWLISAAKRAAKIEGRSLAKYVAWLIWDDCARKQLLPPRSAEIQAISPEEPHPSRRASPNKEGPNV